MEDTHKEDPLELDSLFGDTIPKAVFKPGDHNFNLISRDTRGEGKGAFREKYRPQKLEEVVPTCSIEQLRNQIDNPNASQVFLFEGKSGTGKTTCARIMAKACVCLADNSYDKPCLSCKNCKSYDRSFDKLEVNAADKNKVDDARSFVEDMKTLPAIYNKKIYIFDEVQRLTKDAQQVLLTELEDPRPYLLVFLCTTDIKDINKALVDRCCRVTFKDLTTSHATSIINQIASHEGLKIPDEFKEGMFLQAQGSIRALLNNIQAFAEDGFDPNQATDDEAALEVKTLFKLITKGDWTKLSKELSRSNVRKEPESLRMGLENYMRVVLLGTPNIGEAAKLGNAMIRLRGSLYDEKSSNAMYNAFIVKCLRACCVFI
jgi:DNA polymerase-3 subunit gamma/tau